MRVLIVTSRLAEPLVREVIESIRYFLEENRVSIDIVVSRVPVAALMTVKDLDEVLRGVRDRLGLYDAVIVPGLLIGDIEPVCRGYSLDKCYKGSRFVGDLPRVLEALLRGERLSTSRPADEVIDMGTLEDSRRYFIERSEEAFRIRGLGVPKRSPPVVLVFEVMAGTDIERDIRILEKRPLDKADIIVVGTEAGSDRPDYVRRLVREVSRRYEKVIGIDSLSYEEVESAVSEGASLVMNLSRSYEYWIDRLYSIERDLAFVIVPEDVGRGSATERAEACVREYEYFSARGLRKIVLDPVAPPPLFGTIEALYSIAVIKRRLTDVPVVLGASNIYELIDTDFPGVIALLTVFAIETGASLMLFTEESWKTRGVFEYSTRATELVYRALRKRSPPKDLGIDLFMARDKRRPVYMKIPYREAYTVSERIPPKRLDRSRFFVVQPDYENNMIEVYVFIDNREEAAYLVKGSDPRSLGRKALELAGIEDPEHAFYLGYEISRAYEALRTGRHYEQDTD